MTSLKRQIIGLLEKKDFARLAKLPYSDNKIITILISLSYDKKSELTWRAIESIGIVSKEIARQDPESVRNIVGRLLWMIRDESGGIGWSSPEMLGEIVRNNPRLCSDIAPILASFHEEKMLTTGVLWAMGRIGNINDETREYAAPLFIPYLNSPDRTIRGYAARALGELGASEAAKDLERLTGDENLIPFYEEGILKEKTVGEVAANALEKLVTN